MDAVEIAVDLALWDAEYSAVEVDVFAPGEVAHQACANFDQWSNLSLDGNVAAEGF